MSASHPSPIIMRVDETRAAVKPVGYEEFQKRAKALGLYLDVLRLPD